MNRHGGWTRTLTFAVAMSGLFVMASGCDDTTKFAGACQEDKNCPPGFTCQDGRCRCTSDRVCETGEFCNANTGFCQARMGCDDSLDCPAGQFCDTNTGNCVDDEYCTADVQCEIGQVCDGVSNKCVEGCRTAGDCAFGAVCVCPDGQSCGEILTCEMGPCADDSYCRYGEKCVEESPGAPKRCLRDDRGPYCEPCTIGPGQAYCAGETPNFCLVDTSKNYPSYFCGVDCSTDANSCPWGFGCSDVLILTEQTCGGGGGQCPMRPSPTCGSDADCVDKDRGTHCDETTHTCRCQSDDDCGGGICDVASGKCSSKCVGGEGDVQGFCTCLEHSDCPTDTCDPTTNRCRISQKGCNPANSNSCSPIFCKKVQDPLTKEKIGYCFIGRNCAPNQGITCDMVRAEQ